MRVLNTRHFDGSGLGGRDDLRVDAIEKAVGDVRRHFSTDVADESSDDDSRDGVSPRPAQGDPGQAEHRARR